MSGYILRDETRDRFAPLRSNAREYSEAFTMAGLCGQASARQMADGFVSDHDIASECSFFSPMQRKRAAAALIRIGHWDKVDGGYQMRVWAPEQMSAEKERLRRAQWAERQQRHRERTRFPSHSAPIPNEKSGVHLRPSPIKKSNDSRETSPDVTRDVTGVVTQIPLLSLSESPSETRERIKTPPPAGAPPADAKGPRKVDERRAAWASQLAVASKRHGFVPTALLSAKQTRDVVAKATTHSEATSVPLEEVMRRMLDDAWQRHQAEGKDLKWCVVDWQPNAPQRRSWGRQKLEVADASPNESFGSEEEAWAKLRQRQAQIAADEARRKDMRRVGT